MKFPGRIVIPLRKTFFRTTNWLLQAIALLAFPWMVGAGEDVWTVTQGPRPHDLLRVDFLDPLRGWAVGDSGTIIMTSDGGENWVVQNSGTDFDIVDVSIVGGKYGWVIAQQYPMDTVLTFATELYRTTDGGLNWFFERRFEDFYYFTVDFKDSVNGLLAGDYGRILWTDNGGMSWTPAVIDSPDFARWSIYRFQFYDSLYGIAMGGRFDITGLVWKTTDGGRYWDHQRVAGEPIFGASFLDSTNILCISGDLDIGSGMVRTSNAGENWTYTYLGIWGQATSVSFRTGAEGWSTLGFASTYMVTTDSGNTWTSMFTPDSSKMFDVVFLDSTSGFMVGGGGRILKYNGPPTVVAEEQMTRPADFRIDQNYPNPFNPETTIRYTIAERSSVEVTVVDLSGQEVARIDRGIEPPGRHEVLFNASTIASGVYVCRISVKPIGGAPPSHRSIKMVLLR